MTENMSSKAKNARTNQVNPLLSIRNIVFVVLLLAVVLPVAIVLYVSLSATQTSLVAVIDAELQSSTVAQADSISEILETQVNVLTLLASDAAVRNVLRTTNSGYPVSQEEINARLQEREEEWTATVSGLIEEPFRVRAVYTGTLSTTTLADFQRTFQGHREIVLTDRHGGVVAATNRTEDYIQSDEDWWRFAYNSGVGSLYIDSELIFDRSANVNGIRIAVPVVETDANGNTVVLGILRTLYDISILQDLLSTAASTQSALLLVNEEGRILTLSDNVPEGFIMPANFASAQHDGANSEFELLVPVGDENYIVETAVLSSEGRLPILDSLNWYAAIIESEAIALSPVNNARNAALVPAVLIGLIGTIISVFLASALTRPLQRLTDAASRIGQQRDWNTRVDIEAENEYGQLGRAFNTMAGELQSVFGEMESRIAARTADLETAAEIAAAANQIRQREELLSLTVNLIRDRFDFYYVQAYLVDEASEFAVLADGTGYAGRRLLSRKHRLSLDGQSLVANSVRTGDIIVVQDTTSDARWLPNELLPDTRSEIVVPLRSSQGIIGVLDIQHSIPNSFDAGQQQLFKTLADQLAVTFENVFLLDSAEERAKKLATVAEVGIEAATERNLSRMLKSASKLTRDNFNLYHAHIYLLDHEVNRMVLAAGAGDVGSEMVDNKHSISLDNDHSIVVTAGRRREPVIVNDVTQAPNFLPNPLLPETRAELAVPLLVRDEVIGVLDVQSSSVGRFTDEDAQVLSILSSQLAVAVDNVRTLEEVQEAQQRFESLVQNIPGVVYRCDYDENWTMRYISARVEDLTGYPAESFIGNKERSFGELQHPDDLDMISQAVEEAILSKRPYLMEYRIRDVQGRVRWVAEQGQAEYDDNGEVLWLDGAIFDVTERKLAENEIRRRASRMQAITDISSEIAGVLDVNELLWTAANQSKEKLEHYHVQIYLYDVETKRLNLYAGAGQTGQMMVARRHSIAIESDSLVARAARDHDIVVINDVAAVPDFLPNPSLPDTRAELAVPLLYAGELLGVLDVQDSETDTFTEIEIQVKRTLANQISVALQNARQFELTQVRLQEVLATNAIADFVREDVGVETMMENVMVVAYNSLNADSLVMSMYDATAEQWSGFAGVGEGMSTEIAKTYIDSGDTYPHGMEAIRSQEIVTIEDVKTYPNFPESFIADMDLKSVMVVPILVQGLAIGVIFVNYISHARRFTDDDLRLARTIGNQISVGIERRQSEEQVRRQSTLVEASRDFIGIADLTGNIAYVNPAGLELIQQNLDNVLGKPITMVYPESEWDMINEVGLTTALTQGSWRGETFLKRADGTVFPVEETIFVVKDDEGHILNFATLATDITERKEAAEEQTIQLAILNQLNAAQSRDEAFEVALRYMQDIGASSGNSFSVALNADGEPVILTVENSWDVSEVKVPVGTRYNLAEFPFAELWMSDPSHPFIIEDVSTDTQLDEVTRKTYEALGIKSSVVLPLFYQNRWLALMTFSWDTEVEIAERDKRIFASLMRQMAPVLDAIRATERAVRAQQEAERRAAELETVANVSAATTTILDLDELMQSVADLTKTNFNFYHAHIYLYNEENHQLVLAAGAGDVGRTMKAHGHRLSMNAGTGLVARAARSREAIVVNDTADVQDFLPNPMLPETRSEMAIPMVVGSDLIGVLDVQSEVPNRFTKEDIRIQTTLADQVAVAIRNAQAFERERKTVERLKEVDRLKQEFLANMSHELRTPLNSIIGYSEVLLDGVDGDLTDDAMEDVEAIHTSGKHLLSIINEILDLAKIDAGQMRLSMIDKDIVEVLKHIVVSSQVLVKDKPVTVRLEEASPVEMAHYDPVRLNQIMLNLVGNAIKFTEEGDVVVRYGTDNGKIRVEVIDSGIGMNPEQLGLIFERFRQVDGSSTRRAGGTGLGLTITKQLVEMHGGTIGVSSEEGLGSTFYFILPTAEEAKRLLAEDEDEAVPEVGD